MKRRAFAFLVAALPLLVGASAAGEPTRDALARGRLSLAWDAHESGLCDEALRYALEVPPDSSSRPEALWVEADCLTSLERYGEAAALLESPAAGPVAGRDRLLVDVFWSWAWQHTEREEYGAAIEVLGRGLSSVPDEPSLAAFRLASAFRRELQSSLRGGRLGGGLWRLPGGEEVSVRRRGDRPPGLRWVQVHPWADDAPWVPEATAEEWMPSLAKRLDATNSALWLRVSVSAVTEELQACAGRRGLSVVRGPNAATLRLEGERLPWHAAEWCFRAAVEGLGARGAAAAAAAQAEAALRSRAGLYRWISENRGQLEVSRDGPLLRLVDSRTRRQHALDLGAWAGVFVEDADEWGRFWADLRLDLGRPAASFRCFCGREVVLRETLGGGWPGGLVAEKGPGYVLTLTALCPLHQQAVTEELLRSWGIDLKAAWARARADAVAKPWDVSFERGVSEGIPYLALEGEGVSSLARRPDLLLGALEAVEGREVRGSSVSVLAPTATSLVILGPKTPVDRARAAGNRALLRDARRGASIDRVGYRATLRLPEKAAGVFEMHAAE